ncbi:MAG: glycogen/starch synthase, partial [Candidatus Omnitrophota bacterium]
VIRSNKLLVSIIFAPFDKKDTLFIYISQEENKITAASPVEIKNVEYAKAFIQRICSYPDAFERFEKNNGNSYVRIKNNRIWLWLDDGTLRNIIKKHTLPQGLKGQKSNRTYFPFRISDLEIKALIYGSLRVGSLSYHEYRNNLIPLKYYWMVEPGLAEQTGVVSVAVLVSKNRNKVITAYPVAGPRVIRISSDNNTAFSSSPLAKPRRAAAGSPVSLTSKDILMRNVLNAHFTAVIVTMDIRKRERELLRVASQNGAALFVIKPLFWADVKAGYGTIVKFMQAYGASHLMDIEVPVDRGSTLSLNVIYVEQEGLPVLYLYEPSGNLFVKLRSYPHPDSLGGYIEAIVLPLASLVIQNKLNIQFDAFYFIDWQAALGPVFLKEFYGGNRENEWLLGRRPAALFMPRTLEYQGIFPGCMRVSYKDKLTQYLFKRGVLMLHRYYQDPIANAYPAGHKDEVIVELFKLTNLNPKLRDKTDDGLEFGSRDFVGNTLVFGRHNLMKGVLLYADRIVFDSEGKMKKALTPEGGYGLDGVLRAQRQKLVHSPIKNPFIFAEKKALSASPVKIVKEALRILEMYSNEYRF